MPYDNSVESIYSVCIWPMTWIGFDYEYWLRRHSPSEWWFRSKQSDVTPHCAVKLSLFGIVRIVFRMSTSYTPSQYIAKMHQFYIFWAQCRSLGECWLSTPESFISNPIAYCRRLPLLTDKSRSVQSCLYHPPRQCILLQSSPLRMSKFHFSRSVFLGVSNNTVRHQAWVSKRKLRRQSLRQFLVNPLKTAQPIC